MKKLFVTMALALIAATGVAVAQTQNITLEDIWTKRTFSPRGIGSVRSMADGEHYLSMSRNGISKYSYHIFSALLTSRPMNKSLTSLM